MLGLFLASYLKPSLLPMWCKKYLCFLGTWDAFTWWKDKMQMWKDLEILGMVFKAMRMFRRFLVCFVNVAQPENNSTEYSKYLSSPPRYQHNNICRKKKPRQNPSWYITSIKVKYCNGNQHSCRSGIHFSSSTQIMMKFGQAKCYTVVAFPCREHTSVPLYRFILNAKFS